MKKLGFVVLPMLVVVMGACAGDGGSSPTDGSTDGGNLGTLVRMPHTSSTVWAGFQDGNGTWTRVQPGTDGFYEARVKDANGRYAWATVTETNGNFYQQFRCLTTGEMTVIPSVGQPNRTSTPVTASITLNGMSGTERGFVSYQSFGAWGDPKETITAERYQTGIPNDVMVRIVEGGMPKRLSLQHDVTLGAGNTLAVDTNAHSSPLTVIEFGPEGPDNLDLHTKNGLLYEAVKKPDRYAFTVPDNAFLTDGDFYDYFRYVNNDDGSYVGYRGLFTAIDTSRFQLPASYAPEVTRVAGNTNRVSITFPYQSDADLYRASAQVNQTGNPVFGLSLSPGWHGTGDRTFTLPDLSGVSGFRPEYQATAGFIQAGIRSSAGSYADMVKFFIPRYYDPTANLNFHSTEAGKSIVLP